MNERNTMIAPSTIDELQEHLGEVGASRWHPVTQEDVDRFADATGDDQWTMNYGLDRVRFTAPLPVGDQVRMRASLDSVDARPDGADVATTLTFERAGAERPVCVARLLIRVRS
jgi:acyl dehydratase